MIHNRKAASLSPWVWLGTRAIVWTYLLIHNRFEKCFETIGQQTVCVCVCVYTHASHMSSTNTHHSSVHIECSVQNLREPIADERSVYTTLRAGKGPSTATKVCLGCYIPLWRWIHLVLARVCWIGVATAARQGRRKSLTLSLSLRATNWVPDERKAMRVIALGEPAECLVWAMYYI